MKNIISGICILMLVSSTAFASGKPTADKKKAAKTECKTNCKKTDCKDKTNCPKTICSPSCGK